MNDILFHFEEEKLPPIVFLATAALIAIFALGLLYRLLSIVVF